MTAVSSFLTCMDCGAGPTCLAGNWVCCGRVLEAEGTKEEPGPSAAIEAEGPGGVLYSCVGGASDSVTGGRVGDVDLRMYTKWGGSGADVPDRSEGGGPVSTDALRLIPLMFPTMTCSWAFGGVAEFKLISCGCCGWSVKL